MKRADLDRLGVPAKAHPAAFAALKWMAARGVDRCRMEAQIAAIIATPELFIDEVFQGAEELRDLAKSLRSHAPAYVPRVDRAPCGWWVGNGTEQKVFEQMNRALSLPIAVAGAVMPDAHSGFGVPIGGVLATDRAVIPFAVGVDIGCRVSLSIFELPGLPEDPELVFRSSRLSDLLRAALRNATRFGKGSTFTAGERRKHPVMDDPEWNATPALSRLKDRAWYQLGTSGGGNHFVDLGILDIESETFSEAVDVQPELAVWQGRYLAIMSHSGSRGPGKAVADHFSAIARRGHPELPEELKELAWLSLDEEEGEEYWRAMNLMGRFAAANHEVIHTSVVERLCGEILMTVENHHNFAWLEQHNGRELVVHRKGATPAGAGALGVIPGTMVDPAFLVRGRGEVTSLQSASHGAGRAMSPRQVRNTVSEWEFRSLLDARGVELLDGDLGEAPQGYKDIHRVMSLQEPLVELVGKFTPRIVRMAPHAV